MTNSTNFIGHIEGFLGEIEGGRKFSEEGTLVGAHVVRFPHQPVHGAATYMTVGLSKVMLHQNSGHIRQELLYAQEGEREPHEGAHILADTAQRAVDLGLALPHGQVLGPAGPVVEDSTLEAFVCLTPGYFPEEMAQYDDPTHGIPVVVVMLAPVTRDEAEFVRRYGIDAFEDLLQTEDPNLLDWRRPPFLRWVSTGEPCPDCGQTAGHFHLPDGRVADPR